MNGIVLGGGGALGAYQIGALKALFELGYDYSVVTGTSVGSITGSFLVQKKFPRLIEFWHEITFEDVFDHKFKWKNKGREVLWKAPFIGGFPVTPLKKLMEKEINEKLARESDIKFGLVYTSGFFKYNPVKLDDIPEGQLLNYITVSCSAIPFIRKNPINGKKCYDGFYTDNLPINLAIELGATKVIAIDVLAGPHKKVKDKNIPTFTIKPQKSLGFFLDFSPKKINEYIQLGYDETINNKKLIEFISK